MKANTVKNKKVRIVFFKHEKEKCVSKFLKFNLLNNNKPKRFLSFLLNLTNTTKKISKVQIKNKCVLTGRNKSVDKKYSFSRIVLLNMFRIGIVPGYRKAVW